MQIQRVTYGELPRERWNVLDLITRVAKRSRPAYLISEIDVSACEDLRANLAAAGQRVTITAILLKAISIAQLDFPYSRSFKLANGERVTEQTPVAGFTVERFVDGSPVVFFAVLRDAHLKSLEQIAAELEEYGKEDIDEVPHLAKEVTLTRIPWILRQIGISIGLRAAWIRRSVNPATFGLTSLGKFGMSMLLGPTVSTCIFGVGSVEERPVVVDKKVVVRKMMNLCLSVDTRVITMKYAGRMMHRVQELVESGLVNYLNDSERAAAAPAALADAA